MSDVNVVLPDDLVKEIEAEIAAGRAKSVEAVVTRAVRAYLAALADFRATLDEAEADYRANGGIAWEDIEAEIEADLRD